MNSTIVDSKQLAKLKQTTKEIEQVQSDVNTFAKAEDVFELSKKRNKLLKLINKLYRDWETSGKRSGKAVS